MASQKTGPTYASPPYDASGQFAIIKPDINYSGDSFVAMVQEVTVDKDDRNRITLSLLLVCHKSAIPKLLSVDGRYSENQWEAVASSEAVALMVFNTSSLLSTVGYIDEGWSGVSLMGWGDKKMDYVVDVGFYATLQAVMSDEPSLPEDISSWASSKAS